MVGDVGLFDGEIVLFCWDIGLFRERYRALWREIRSVVSLQPGCLCAHEFRGVLHSARLLWGRYRALLQEILGSFARKETFAAISPYPTPFARNYALIVARNLTASYIESDNLPLM